VSSHNDREPSEPNDAPAGCSLATPWWPWPPPKECFAPLPPRVLLAPSRMRRLAGPIRLALAYAPGLLFPKAGAAAVGRDPGALRFAFARSVARVAFALCLFV
jgi:hypothetical protein